jgi:hypothetical protein
MSAGKRCDMWCSQQHVHSLQLLHEEMDALKPQNIGSWNKRLGFTNMTPSFKKYLIEQGNSL